MAEVSNDDVINARTNARYNAETASNDSDRRYWTGYADCLRDLQDGDFVTYVAAVTRDRMREQTNG